MSQQVLPIALGLMLLVIVFELVRQRRLRERYAVFWMVLGLALLAVGMFPGATEEVAATLGFELPSNLVFLISIIILFALAVQAGVEIAGLQRDVRTLAEEVAILRLETTRRSKGDSGDDSA